MSKIEMFGVEMHRAIANARNIEFVMKADSQIDKALDIAENCRKNISDRKIRDLEKRALLLAENLLKTRNEMLSDPIFDDIREKYYEHGLICSSLIESYREELSMYE